MRERERERKEFDALQRACSLFINSNYLHENKSMIFFDNNYLVLSFPTRVGLRGYMGFETEKSIFFILFYLIVQRQEYFAEGLSQSELRLANTMAALVCRRKYGRSREKISLSTYEISRFSAINASAVKKMLTISLEELCRYTATRNIREGLQVINSGLLFMCGVTAKTSVNIELYVLCLQTSGITSYPLKHSN